MSRSYHAIAGGALALPRMVLLTLAGLTTACSDRSPSSPDASRVPAKPAGIIIDLLQKQIVYGAVTNTGPQVFRVNPDGSWQNQITQGLGLGGSLPSWSPDHLKIVYSRNINGVLTLMIMKADGSLNVTHGPGYYARWSPDGSKIVFQRHVNGGAPQVFVSNADGTGIQQLAFHQFGSYVPSWSQDGSKIVYAAAPAGGSGGQLEVWVMNANGANPHQVTNCTTQGMWCSGADWHPTSGDNRIVYSVSPLGASTLSQIRTIRANGNDDTLVRSVPNVTANKFPVWSPDGTRIAYLDLRPGWDDEAQIYTIFADGTQRQRVTSSSFIKQGFDW